MDLSILEDEAQRTMCARLFGGHGCSANGFHCPDMVTVPSVMKVVILSSNETQENVRIAYSRHV